MVKNSSAFDSAPTRCVMIYGGTFGFGIHGIALISANVSITRLAVPTSISGIKSKKNDNVMLYLSNGIKNHIILYDDDKDTGWLIPQATAFLFLMQIFLLRRPMGLKFLLSEMLSLPAHNGGQAAFETLLRFKEASAHSDGDDYWAIVKETIHYLFYVLHDLC
jgi:hypothetical protein